jgi:hemolysin activation/secretion protein
LQAYFTARYHRRNLERHLFSVSLNALATRRLDPESQVLVGGDNGPRGYSIRHQAGERPTLLGVEQRFFTNWYPWRLLRIGYAIFADLGSVGGRDPRATPSLGTLADIGVGLLLTSPRASGRKVVQVDLAFPLDRQRHVDGVQLVVETKRSF